MQYEVKESGYGVTITSAKFDVVITPEAPLNVAIGESARMEIPQAINYIKSGEAEIKAATDIGISRIGSTVTDGINRFNANASDKTTAFNDNATNKTTAFNNNAAIKQAAVDALVDKAKQWAIGEPSEPSGYSAKYWANQAASTLSGLDARVTTIEGDIPAQASSSNQLADKNFVNSSIATNTANFIGTFNSVADLEAYSGTLTNNDYAFVVSTDFAGNTVYNRYKWNGTSWLFEYALNNSSFTANQWAAINSGATTTNIGQIATALQPADLNNTLAALYPVGAIYIGTQATCPLATLISGSTWELISAGRVLQGADSGHAAGTTIEAGLPNITGAFEFGNISGVTYPVGATRGDGAFVGAKYGSVANYGTGSYSSSNQALEFYASRSNAIYGNSTTVQPPAYVVNIWRRTA